MSIKILNDIGMDSNKLKIVLTSLSFVGKGKWAWAPLEKAAIKLGYETPYARLLYGGDLKEPLRVLHDYIEELMKEEIGIYKAEASRRIHEIVTQAVRIRMLFFYSEPDAFRAIGKYLLYPANFSFGQGLLYKAVDAIWYEAQDVTSDFNYYSKRLLLSYAYQSTLGYFLKDKSFEAVDSFMVKRFEDIRRLGEIKQKLFRRASS